MINSISLALRAGSDDDGVVIVQSSSLFELSRFGHLRRTSRAYSAAIARSGIDSLQDYAFDRIKLRESRDKRGNGAQGMVRAICKACGSSAFDNAGGSSLISNARQKDQFGHRAYYFFSSLRRCPISLRFPALAG